MISLQTMISLQPNTPYCYWLLHYGYMVTFVTYREEKLGYMDPSHLNPSCLLIKRHDCSLPSRTSRSSFAPDLHDCRFPRRLSLRQIHTHELSRHQILTHAWITHNLARLPELYDIDDLLPRHDGEAEERPQL